MIIYSWLLYFFLHRRCNFLPFSSTDKTWTFTFVSNLYHVSGCFTGIRQLGTFSAAILMSSLYPQMLQSTMLRTVPWLSLIWSQVSLSPAHLLSSGASKPLPRVSLAFRFHSKYPLAYIRRYSQLLPVASSKVLSDLYFHATELFLQLVLGTQAFTRL